MNKYKYTRDEIARFVISATTKQGYDFFPDLLATNPTNYIHKGNKLKKVGEGFEPESDKINKIIEVIRDYLSRTKLGEFNKLEVYFDDSHLIKSFNISKLGIASEIPEESESDKERKTKDIYGVYTILPRNGGGEMRFKLFSVCAKCDKRLEKGEMICSKCNPQEELEVEELGKGKWEYRFNGTGEWMTLGNNLTEITDKLNSLIKAHNALVKEVRKQ